MANFQIDLQGQWKDFAKDEDKLLKRAYAAGFPNCQFRIHGKAYEYNFNSMVQKSLASGKERKIRAPHHWKPPAKPIVPRGPVVCIPVPPHGPGSTIQIPHPTRNGSKLNVAVPSTAKVGQAMLVPIPTSAATSQVPVSGAIPKTGKGQSKGKEAGWCHVKGSSKGKGKEKGKGEARDAPAVGAIEPEPFKKGKGKGKCEARDAPAVGAIEPEPLKKEHTSSGAYLTALRHQSPKVELSTDTSPAGADATAVVSGGATRRWGAWLGSPQDAKVAAGCVALGGVGAAAGAVALGVHLADDGDLADDVGEDVIDWIESPVDVSIDDGFADDAEFIDETGLDDLIIDLF